MDHKVTLRKLLASRRYNSTAEGAEKRFCCPFCENRGHAPDTNYCLALHDCEGWCEKCRERNIDLRGCYVCPRCGVHGSIRDATAVFTQDSWDRAVHQLTYGHSATRKAEVPRIDPPATLDLRPGMLAYTYLRKRGMTEEDIRYFGLRLGTEKLAGRIVIPDLDTTGRWTYWVARDYTGRSKKRYFAPSGVTASRTAQVFHLDRVKTPYVYITEGVFSAMLVGRDAVALYGKSFSVGQLNRLSKRRFERYYCVLDPDAPRENLALAEALTLLGHEAYVVDLPPDGDPADHGRYVVMRCAEKAQRWNERLHLEKMLAAGCK